jgi:hypothetical protein
MPLHFFSPQLNSLKNLISFTDCGRTFTQVVSGVQSLRIISRLFDTNFNLIVLKEVLLKQQRLLNTFNFIIIPPQRSC